MRCKKFLLIPGNNSLSHVVKCLATRDALQERGHTARVAVSRKHSTFLKRLAIDHIVLPDIQETDESGFPSVEWFRQPQHIIDCINAEVELLKAFRPDRVLGVFRFTLKTSAQIAGVPYDSLICGCMIPDSSDVLGYDDDEPGRKNQQIILDGFFQYAGSRLGRALSTFGLPRSNGDIRNMLKGEQNFLWDFPEFAPLTQNTGLCHVGPLVWNHWPYDAFNREELRDGKLPLAVVAFGTCSMHLPSAQRIIKVLLNEGYRVLLAAGGQKDFLNIMPGDPRVITHTFAPLPEILPHARLLVTHGGQMTVFEALQNKVPVVVMPFQPEQAHNGVCLQRMGCGIRLVPAQPFQGNPSIYQNALDCMTDEEIGSKITSLVHNPSTKDRLAEASAIINQFTGAQKIAELMGGR